MISILKNSHLKTISLLAFGSVVLAACGGGSNDTPTPTPTPPPVAVAMAKYNVTVVNNTNNQPFSPIAVVAHNTNYSMFSIGSSASLAIEEIAESGNNSRLINDSSSDANSVAQVSGNSPIQPGSSETVELEFPESDIDFLSLVTMYENTNDAISGTTAFDLKNVAVDATVQIRGFVYDAGTERNTETSSTVPGPAVGGEGFNSARDDLADQVTMHPGVVSRDDGLSTSALTEAEKFDNPGILIRITRTQ